SDDPSRHPGDDRVVGHVFRHHRARPDQCADAHGYSAEDGRVAADRCPGPDQGPDDLPVCIRLERAVRVHRPRVGVVDEHHAVTDEHAVLYGDAFTDEGVARDLAAGSDGGALLDLHERADPRAAADAAPVEVDELRMEHDDTLGQLHILGDHLDPTRLAAVA